MMRVLMDRPSLHLQIILQSKLSFLLYLFPFFQSYEQWVPPILRLILLDNTNCPKAYFV